MNSEINFTSNVNALVEDLKFGALSHIIKMTQKGRHRSSSEFCETFHMIMLAIKRKGCVTIEYTTTTTTTIVTEGTSWDKAERGTDQD